MNATELYLKDGKPTDIYFCGTCRLVAHSKALAEQCCQNYKCNVCGKDTGGRTWLVCDECRQKQDAEKEERRFQAAEKLTSWDGYVFDPVSCKFYDDTDELLDDLEGFVPKYVWTCKANPFVKVDVSDILERIAENGYEDFDADTLNGIPELEEAARAFEEANKDVLSYEPDYTKALILKNDETLNSR